LELYVNSFAGTLKHTCSKQLLYSGKLFDSLVAERLKQWSGVCLSVCLSVCV